jgi:hypothetical protein
MNERIRKIQNTVEKFAGCPATYLKSIVVIEGFQSQTMWKGVVEVFTLEGHAKAKRAYAWQLWEDENAQYTVVLEIPPVDSANTAVRASIAAEAKQ